METTTLTDQIVTLLEERGGDLYFGEAVTEREHALQCATAALREGAAASLITAALLHDLGHLLHCLGEDAVWRGVDARHEEVGSAWLARHFPPDVCEPIRLHVAAKRFLCGIDPGYLEGLSSASRQSLELQGGPMSDSEQAEFLAMPHTPAAIALRRWDDAAKVPGAATPSLQEFRPYLEAALRGDAE